MLTQRHANQVRKLLAEHIGNPRRQAARAARAQYIGELFAASMYGEDVDREAEEWLRRLTELCGDHASIPDIAHWYTREEQRLLHLANR